MTIMSMITVTLFFGGWRGPFSDAIGVGGVYFVPIFWFLLKTYVLVFALIWIRLSVPRLQVDQLMSFAWKVLIPLGPAQHPRQRRRDALGAELEVGDADLPVGGAPPVHRPVRPHPALATRASAAKVTVLA